MSSLVGLQTRAAFAGGWREREKAREESWGPPREGSQDGDDGEMERPRDRRPQRCVRQTYVYQDY